MVGRAGAGILMAGLLSACFSTVGEPSFPYVRYSFTCCTAVDGLGAWRPGDTINLQWIVGAYASPTDNPLRAVVLTADLQGPYATVDALKSGAAATTTLSAPPINTDDHNPAAPTSQIKLPARFAPGLYNLAFAIDYGDGNSMSGASVLQLGGSSVGDDPFAPLSQRPMKLPVLGSTSRCPATSSTSLGDRAPNYGFGAGPAYLSGQFSWYAGGQVAVVMVDSGYMGPLLIRAAGLGGAQRSQITLTDMPSTEGANIVGKEARTGVTVVPAIHTSDGQLELQPSTGSPSWRAWFGWLQTEGAGCFALQLDGIGFSEVIVINVQSGPARPG